jgi:hypothetical protein
MHDVRICRARVEESIMILMPKPGKKSKASSTRGKSSSNMVGERMIVLKEKREAIRFVTTIDNLRSFYEYAAG